MIKVWFKKTTVVLGVKHKLLQLIPKL